MTENATQTGSRPQFTLRGLLLTVGVVALLLGLVVSVLRTARHAAWRASCENNIKLIGLALADYESRHGSLPPAYTTDENGVPAVSWRVLAAQSVWYDYDFPARMDFSKPWNGPGNAPFINSLNAGWLQCPASRNAKPGITHYVAVVGPGTAWPGKEPGKLPKPTGEKITPGARNPILVVEWPQSDIHWAEPRDVTVDEFLDLFRSKSGRLRCHHRDCILYVDTQGEVHELPIDSDSDTVRSLLMIDPS